MSLPIAPTPQLDEQDSKKFYERILRDEQKPARIILTPNIDKIIKQIIEDTEK